MSRKLLSPLTFLPLLAGIAGILIVLYAWRLPPFLTSVEVTDNAYVRGYITVMSPQVSGYVVEVPVKDYQAVDEGQVLVRIDDRSYVQRLAQANATLATQRTALDNSMQQENSANANIASSKAAVTSAQAALHQAELAYERQDSLLRSGVGVTSTREQAEATLEKAKAALDQSNAALEVSNQSLRTIIVNRGSLEAAVSGAEASVKLAEIDLQNTVVHAPRDGKIGEVGARVGQYVTAGTQLMSVVPDEIWVVANFKETQLNGMKVGQPVTISVDALGRRSFTGHIERFSPATGSEFAVIKADNATGNFVKIAQRVGVRIVFDAAQPGFEGLVPGLSVLVTIDKSKAGDGTQTALN